MYCKAFRQRMLVRKMICSPGKVWSFHSGMKGRAVLQPMLGTAVVSLDVCRHTDGSQKDKGKAGTQRQIKTRQREKGALTSAAPLTTVSGQRISVFPLISSLSSTYKEDRCFLYWLLFPKKNKSCSFFETKSRELCRENSSWFSSKIYSQVKS